MKIRLHCVLAAALLAACGAPSSSRVTNYPAYAKDPVVDDYHGTQIPDPWRGLEDPDSAPTRSWIDAQNKLTREWIDATPRRAAIEARLTQLWNFERHGAPFEKKGRLYFWKNDGLRNQSVLHVQDSPDAEPRVLLDPNSVRADGTWAVGQVQVSPDGELLAYAGSEAGSDWNTIRFRRVGDGVDLPDVVEWVKFSGLAWSKDSGGIWYSTYPEHDTSGKKSLANHQLRHHRLGTTQAQDLLVHARPDQPEWGFGATTSDDHELLVVSQTQGTEQKNRVFLQALGGALDAPLEPLFDAFDAEYEFLGKRGQRLWFKTDKDAPRGRIVAIDLGARERLIEIVPEGRDTLESALLAGNRLVVSRMVDAANAVQVHELDGATVGSIVLPGLGSVGGVWGDLDCPRLYYTWSGFTSPGEVHKVDMASLASKAWRKPELTFDPALYDTEQHRVKSKDGTEVPLFLVRRKGAPMSADTPVLLYGYGGFNIPIKPAFSPAIMGWLEMGGAYASANLRGGGEYGRDWHQAGTKERKQNVFDDFIACAEWLISTGRTSPRKLAIHGRSNGGLLVGACMAQRPDLFGAALPGVGVLDMLRYHRFTIGWAWASDYGRSDDAQAFPYLLKYSPLHNLRQGVAYPATLITTGDHDDRVVPAHSFKFAAELQEKTTGGAALIRIETRGGHGAGKPTAMVIEEWADIWAFLARALDFDPSV